MTGEKRRTSLGVALVTNPSTIFLDEPTSGLDSVAARTVLQLLDKVAVAGNTVLFTIHQPSSRVFSAFDNVILINSGRLMHMSSTSLIPTDFAERGFPIPANTNPADWILVRKGLKLASHYLSNLGLISWCVVLDRKYRRKTASKLWKQKDFFRPTRDFLSIAAKPMK
jgi:ABC-type multidrug transport system ATPase subunit